MALITKPNTFSAGATIVASEHNSNYDTIYDAVNGNLNNANIASSAGIVGSKLNLSTPGTIGATSASPGTFTDLTSTGNTTIGNASGDSLTIHPNAWTLSNAVTVTGTWTDLGTVTTANIDGGTLDGVQIGGTTATGELIVNDSSDDANGLGDQGTSGEFLQSAGAGSNPVWAAVTHGITFVSVTAVSTTNSGNITIAANKLYKVIISMTEMSADASTIGLRFNSLTDGEYFYFNHGLHTPGTNTAIDGGATSASEIKIGEMDATGTHSNFLTAELLIDTHSSNNSNARVIGKSIHYQDGGVLEFLDIAGQHERNATTLTDFEIFSNAGNMTGNIYLYEYTLS